MNSTRLNRRDLLLMSSGAAALCLGRLADGMLPSASSGSSPDLLSAVKRLNLIPERIGAWKSEARTISDHEQRAASIHGYVRRNYQNEDSGYRVGMTLLCGPSGPMAVHPPTACFEGVGYVSVAGPVPTSFSRRSSQPEPTASRLPDVLNKSTFRQHDSAISQTIRVFWGWSTHGNWSAPHRPRIEFRGTPWLYKLYVTDQTATSQRVATIPQAETFLQDALPVLRRHLSTPPQPHPMTPDSTSV